jgi:hypothetical protein
LAIGRRSAGVDTSNVSTEGVGGLTATWTLAHGWDKPAEAAKALSPQSNHKSRRLVATEWPGAYRGPIKAHPARPIRLASSPRRHRKRSRQSFGRPEPLYERVVPTRHRVIKSRRVGQSPLCSCAHQLSFADSDDRSHRARLSE